MNYSEIFLKSTVKRATKKCNLFCKTGAKRVEHQCSTFYLLPTKKNLQPYLLLDRFNVGGKTRNISIQLDGFCINVSEQVARFLLPILILL